jgi:hypothetical protein
MLQNSYTLASTKVVDKLYNTPNASRFSCEATAQTAPYNMYVKHNTLKDGRVQTAVEIIDDQIQQVNGIDEVNRVKCLIKFTYQPVSRANMSTDITNILNDVKGIVDTELASLLNKEV